MKWTIVIDSLVLTDNEERTLTLSIDRSRAEWLTTNFNDAKVATVIDQDIRKIRLTLYGGASTISVGNE